MIIKNTEKKTATVLAIPEDTSIRVETFVWEKNYKEAKRKEITFKYNENKTYSLLL